MCLNHHTVPVYLKPGGFLPACHILPLIDKCPTPTTRRYYLADDRGFEVSSGRECDQVQGRACVVAQDDYDLLLLEGERLVPELHGVEHVSTRIEVRIRKRVEVVDRAISHTWPVMVVEEG